MRPLVESNEVFPVESEHGSGLRDGERQDLLVRQGLFRLPALLYGQHVVAQRPQRLDNGQGEVLVLRSWAFSPGVMDSRRRSASFSGSVMAGFSS